MHNKVRVHKINLQCLLLNINVAETWVIRQYKYEQVENYTCRKHSRTHQFRVFTFTSTKIFAADDCGIDFHGPYETRTACARHGLLNYESLPFPTFQNAREFDRARWVDSNIYYYVAQRGLEFSTVRLTVWAGWTNNVHNIFGNSTRNSEALLR